MPLNHNNELYKIYISQTSPHNYSVQAHSDGHLDGDSGSHIDEHADRPNA